MIQQLGSANLCITLRAAETRWKHVLKILYNVLDGRILSDDDCDQLDWSEKCRLISSGPVTCARHFDLALNRLFHHFF